MRTSLVQLSRVLISGVVIGVVCNASHAVAAGPTSYRSRLLSDYGITLFDGGRLNEATQIKALHDAVSVFPKGALPSPTCNGFDSCLNAIRVRDLLVGTNASGHSPYTLTNVALADQWWNFTMVPQGYSGPNIFYDFATLRDQLIRDDAPAYSNNYLAVVFHELMHGVDSRLYQRTPRYRAWRDAMLEELGTDRENYIRIEVADAQGAGYFQEHPNELMAGLMNAWQQDSNAMLGFCLSQEKAPGGTRIVSQCLAILDVLSVAGYGKGTQSTGIVTNENAAVTRFAIPISRHPVTGYVDGFVFAGTWHRYELDEHGVATAVMTLQCGDTNGDGFSLEDYLYISLVAKGLATCTHEICDINHDGVITRKDASIVRRSLRSRTTLDPCVRGEAKR